jgi:glycosyltransferase involved in cell wall biosynthesis
LPTLSEGFAHVILEAMASGLPVITTGHSCGPDIITDGKEGWIIPIRSVKSLTEKLEWCMNNKKYLFDMGQSAADTASKYTWEKFRNRIIDFYESAIPDS